MVKISTVHQIELTSRCNLRCHYCPHPALQRPKADMSMDVYKAALAWAQTMESPELSLTGMGEGTLHPQFCEMLRMAREALPETKLLLSTNGINITDEMLAAMRETKTILWISAHRPEIAGRTLQRSLRAGVMTGINNHIIDSGFNWAGQVDWHVSAAPSRCMWQAQGMAIAWADGRLGTCSFDGQGSDGVLGTVWDDPATIYIKPYSLCKNCHQTIN